MVTYIACVFDDDSVFKALADPTRRFLLDLLFNRDGRTLTELESELAMSRFGVMKHLRVLERAGFVVTRRAGREKLHFLNPVPIRMIHDRWNDKYAEHRVSALLELKNELETKARRQDKNRSEADDEGVTRCISRPHRRQSGMPSRRRNGQSSMAIGRGGL